MIEIKFILRINIIEINNIYFNLNHNKILKMNLI